MTDGRKNVWRRIAVLGIIAVAALLPLEAHAGARYYEYNGKKYGNEKKALEAQRMHIAELVARVDPAPAPAVESMLLVVPSKELVISRRVTTSWISSVYANVTASVGELMSNEYQAHGEYVRKRGLARQVTVFPSTAPEKIASEERAKYAAVVYLPIEGDKPDEWFVLRGAGSDKPIPLPPLNQPTTTPIWAKTRIEFFGGKTAPATEAEADVEQAHLILAWLELLEQALRVPDGR
jgi:hypothetical protein